MYIAQGTTARDRGMGAKQAKNRVHLGWHQRCLRRGNGRDKKILGASDRSISVSASLGEKDEESGGAGKRERRQAGKEAGSFLKFSGENSRGNWVGNVVERRNDCKD